MTIFSCNANALTITELGGNITQDTTLLAGQAYNVTSLVTIAPGITVTVEAGVVLNHINAYIRVEGSLVAAGAAGSEVIFTSNFTGDPAAAPGPGSWSGVLVAPGASLTVDHAIFENASTAIRFQNDSSGAVTNSQLSNNNFGVLIAGNASPQIANSTITNNALYGVFVVGQSGQIPGQAQIINNNITGNGTYGVYVQGVNNEASDPLPVFHGNSLLTNGSYDIAAANYGNPGVVLNATSNWWGSTDVAVIRQRIFDHKNSPTLYPFVDFGEFLDGPGGNVVGDKLLIGDIETDRTLSAGSSYLVVQTTFVRPGVTLTIEPGTTIRHVNGYLRVEGSLVVAGVVDNEVTFTSGQTDPSAGNWSGVVIDSGGSLTMDHAIAEYAGSGVNFLDGSSGTVSNSRLSNNNIGLSIRGSASPVIDGNTISGNALYGVYVAGESGQSPSQALVLNNTVTENGNYGVYLRGASNPGSDPLPVFHGNSLMANGSHELHAANYGDSDLVINATGNWWGSTNPYAIWQRIYEHRNNPAWNPYVDFSGFLDGPGGTAVGGTLLLGDIETDTTLAANSSYLIVGAKYVRPSATLTIEPGVRLSFVNGYIRVEGQLVVAGAAGNEVVFTSGLASPAAGNWSGVQVTSSGSLTMDYTITEYAGSGVAFFNGSSGTVTNSHFTNNISGASVQGSASPLFDGNYFSGNTYGVYIVGLSGQNAGLAQFLNNTITDNGYYGVYVQGANSAGSDPLPVFHGNSLTANNGSYDFYSVLYGDAAVVLDVTGNWWGTADVALIGPRIYDHYNNPAQSPFVDYGLFLDGPGGTAVGGNILTGDVETDRTLTAGLEYIVVNNINVRPGATLTIEPGVRLSFINSTPWIQGSLVISGTPGNEVVLTSGQANPGAGNWSGVLVATGGNLTMDHAIVEYANNGVIFYNGSGGTVTNSHVSNSNVGLVIGGNASPVVDGNTFSDNALFGIYIVGHSGQSPGLAQVRNNTITANGIYGAYVRGANNAASDPLPVFNGNSILANNGTYDFYTTYFGNADVVLNATGNWWGNTDVNVIAQQIYEHNDSPTQSPYVDFSGYLDGPAGSNDNDGDGISNDFELQVGTDPDDAVSVPADINADGIPDVINDLVGIWTGSCVAEGGGDYRQSVLTVTTTEFRRAFHTSAEADCTTPWISVVNVYDYSLDDIGQIAGTGAPLDIVLKHVEVTANDAELVNSLMTYCSSQNFALGVATDATGISCQPDVHYPNSAEIHYDLIKNDAGVIQLGAVLDVTDPMQRATAIGVEAFVGEAQ